MFTNYDLYDLYAVLIRVRAKPNYDFNEAILDSIVKILDGYENSEDSCIRKVLRNIQGLDIVLYSFVFVDNYYTFVPLILKDRGIYGVLSKACNALLSVVQSKNTEQVFELADCLHNLPIEIAQSGRIPKKFWQNEVKFYRQKWDSNFLKN